MVDKHQRMEEGVTDNLKEMDELRQEIALQTQANYDRLRAVYLDKSNTVLSYMRDLRDKMIHLSELYEEANAKYSDLHLKFCESTCNLERRASETLVEEMRRRWAGGTAAAGGGGRRSTGIGNVDV